jgi:hypothetical protein
MPHVTSTHHVPEMIHVSDLLLYQKVLACFNLQWPSLNFAVAYFDLYFQFSLSDD